MGGSWTVPAPTDGVMDVLNAAAAAVPMCLLLEAPPTWPWQRKPAGVWERRRGSEKSRQMVESLTARFFGNSSVQLFFFFPRISTYNIFSWAAENKVGKRGGERRREEERGQKRERPDLTLKNELTVLLFLCRPLVGVNMFYVCIIVYLYGDLAIYAAAVPVSLMEVAW